MYIFYLLIRGRSIYIQKLIHCDLKEKEEAPLKMKTIREFMIVYIKSF